MSEVFDQDAGATMPIRRATISPFRYVARLQRVGDDLYRVAVLKFDRSAEDSPEGVWTLFPLTESDANFAGSRARCLAWAQEVKDREEARRNLTWEEVELL